jgi:hypothetical protein
MMMIALNLLYSRRASQGKNDYQINWFDKFTAFISHHTPKEIPPKSALLGKYRNYKCGNYNLFLWILLKGADYHLPLSQSRHLGFALSALGATRASLELRCITIWPKVGAVCIICTLCYETMTYIY